MNSLDPHTLATAHAALRIARRHAEWLLGMGEALDRDDLAAVVRWARLLTGRAHDEENHHAESDRPHPGEFGIPGDPR